MKSLGKIKRGAIDEPWLKIPYAEVDLGDAKLRYAESNRLAIKRVETLYTKEPTTIPWLDQIKPGEVLFDIGANVGMYTIYAGKLRRAKVYAFEPEALNYAELNKNIFLNGLNDRVLAYCMAIGDQTKVDRLLLGGFAEGLSHHDFGESTWTTDKDFGAIKTAMDARLQQGCVSFSIDGMVEAGQIPPPKFIKIDVDGLEHKVVDGAWRTFARPDVDSILLEIDHRLPQCVAIVDRMLSAGWKYSTNQLRANRKVIFTVEQVTRMRETGKGGFNYIFFRDNKYADLYSQFLQSYVPPLGGA